MLGRIRDIALTVMAVLVSAVCVVALYVVFAAGSALAHLGDQVNNPTPAVTENFDPGAVPTNPAGQECVGEEPPPGC
jgi:hypothetical protein